MRWILGVLQKRSIFTWDRNAFTGELDRKGSNFAEALLKLFETNATSSTTFLVSFTFEADGDDIVGILLLG